MRAAFCVCCLQLPYQTCAYEMSFFGINLKKLVAQNSKDLLFSEVGVGGGSNDGRCGRPQAVCVLQGVDTGVMVRGSNTHLHDPAAQVPCQGQGVKGTA